MLIDPSGKLNVSPYESKLTQEERIEIEHADLMRLVKPLLRANPLEYEQLLRGFEHHDIIRARYRLYALTRAGYFPDCREKIEEIGALQKYIGDFEMTMVDWPTGDTLTSSNKNDDDWNEEDDSESEPMDE
jgi:hypothetical protein